MILKDFDVLAQAEACQGDYANKACCAEKLRERESQYLILSRLRHFA